MAGFDRMSLSPVLTIEEVIDLPFGLTWAQVTAALPDLDPRAVADCRALKRYEIQGLHDRAGSVVVSFEYPTRTGHAIRDVFVKHSPALEADRHVQLAAAGVPLPRLLLTADAATGNQVLGFEFLDTIGIDFESSDEVRELLALVATLNAVDPAALGGASTPPPGRPEAEFTAGVERALVTARSMSLLDWASMEVSDWLEVYREAKGWAASMPRAVTHGEMYFQQVGRAGNGPLVIFDLATVGVRPRFFDLCSLVRGLVRYAADDEAAVLAAYLDALTAASVTVPSVLDSLDELRRLRVLSCFQSLPWLARSLDNPELGLDALEDKLSTLRGDLFDLGIVRPSGPH